MKLFTPAVAILGLTFSLTAGAQTVKQKRALNKSSVPRAANGKPDLSGVYQPSNVRGTWEEANSGSGVGGSGTDSTPPPPERLAARQVHREVPPYKPEAAKRVLESYNNRDVDDPAARCLPLGVPRANSIGLFPIRIVQAPNQIVMLYEYMNVYRVIHMNAKHPDDLAPSYMGHSVGHWEGDTLVVDVTGFNDRTWLIGAGTFHSEALHVTERYTRVDRDTINYDVIMEDPNVLTKPWNYESTLMLREGSDLQEYVCNDNNLDPGHYEELLKKGVNFNRQ